ncbi:MAG: M24 family metallopeptidase [Planctomycetaceae bacterium]|nr:M24 family metallopeptidase [Planctomycetaceae bacterium]
MNIRDIQQAIRDNDGDGWLFFDIHQRDPIAYQILGLDIAKFTTRRWYYFVPREGTPTKLIHRVELGRIASLPGNTVVYVGWKELHEKLKRLLEGSRRVFMQYSPLNNIPMVSFVDAGTVELVRSMNKEVLSSAELVQFLEARVDEVGAASHRAAGVKVQRIKDEAFRLMIDAIRSGRRITEYDVQQFILAEFEKGKLTCDNSPPMVGVNEHAADPHFEVSAAGSAVIKENDRVLIDLWARENTPQGIYYDITWCGFMGRTPDPEYQKMFDVAVQARELTKRFVTRRLADREPVYGWQADDVCRSYIAEQGYGSYIAHRTGHSIHRSVHGNGANLDNLETRDERRLIPNSCFSIEPGIYKDGIGVRTEIDALIDGQGNLSVAGPEQQKLVLLD